MGSPSVHGLNDARCKAIISNHDPLRFIGHNPYQRMQDSPVSTVYSTTLIFQI